MNAPAELLDDMAANGVAPAGEFELIADGRWHPFDVEGDRPGRRNGRFISDGTCPLVVTYLSHRIGCYHTWRERQPMSDAERRTYREHVRAQRERQARAADEGHRDAARRAAELWDRSREPNRAHTYLRGKGIRPHGVRQLGESLVVPMQDAAGALWGLQFISPTGSKRFLRGQRVRGLFHVIGAPTSRVWICEGFATGASLHEDQREQVIAAFSAGNLLPVGEAIKRAWPPVTLAIMADDDFQTPGNPGTTAAAAAAARLGCDWFLPQFPDRRPSWASDFNDAQRLWRTERASA